MKKIEVIKKIILTICIFFACSQSIFAKETVEFAECVDGDTFKVTIDNKKYTVRMLAVDTPESVHPTKGVEYYGKEASNYTCDILKNAKKIELEYDENSDKTDKYDRLLAWVFIDDELHQANLIEKGYAKIAYLYDDYKYTKDLEELQEKASAKEIGIWNTDAKNEYNNQNGITEEETSSKKTDDEVEENINQEKASSEQEYSTKDIIIIAILLLVIVFASKTSTKNKAKKKLKKYLD